MYKALENSRKFTDLKMALPHHASKKRCFQRLEEGLEYFETKMRKENIFLQKLPTV